MNTVIPAMESKTTDIVADNVIKLKELFPEAFTEGKVDFDALKEVLGEYIDGRDERYSFTWNGKSKARKIAQTPSTGTLRPCKEESIDWDSTQNLFIEGDNLEVLKLLQKSYHKKVKMIYIDPPYNTGKDFVYKDNFKDNIKNYKEITGQVDTEGRNISNNPETSGRYHTDWLNMMYPRLKLARNLLKEDGLIFVSIDDNESGNLKKVLDEVFGEENLLSVHHIQVRYGNKSLNERKDFQEILETIYIYSKNKPSVRLNKPTIKYPIEKFNLEVKHNETPDLTIEKRGRTMDVWKKGSFQINKVAPSIDGFKETWISGSILTGTGHGLMYSSMIDDRVDEDGNGCLYRIHGVGEDGLGYRYYTNPVDEKASRGKMLTKVPLSKREMLLSGSATKDLPILNFYDFSGDFGNIRHEGGVPFNAGKKPVKLLRQLINYFPDKDMTILDFFAGSASTAHAAIAQNAEDGGSRKFILAQLPEPIDPKDKVVAKICDDIGCERLISEVGKERIRRSAANIKEENPDYDGDLGFKVFKLDSTNIKPWEVDFDLNEQDLEDQISNIKNDRAEDDVLYEVLLKYGLDLTLPITEHAIAGHKVFDIGMGALMICLSDDISLEVVEGIAKLKDELAPEIMRVVFKDAGFADDVVKTNAVQILKQAGIEDVRSL